MGHNQARLRTPRNGLGDAAAVGIGHLTWSYHHAHAALFAHVLALPFWQAPIGQAANGQRCGHEAQIVRRRAVALDDLPDDGAPPLVAGQGLQGGALGSSLGGRLVTLLLRPDKDAHQRLIARRAHQPLELVEQVGITDAAGVHWVSLVLIRAAAKPVPTG